MYMYIHIYIHTYTTHRIPHDDGLDNLRNALLVNSIPTLTINGIRDMTELVRDVFEFNNEYFIQTSGTAIGTN